MADIRYKIICLVTILLLICAGNAYSQIPDIELRPGISGQDITDKLAVTKIADESDPEEVWKILQDTAQSGDYYYGFVQEYVWGGLSLKSSSETETWIIEVENPHLNYIEIYVKESGGTWKQTGSTGRAMPFNTRNIDHTNFAFDITVPAGEAADVLLMFDKRRSSISYPVKLWSEEEFYHAQQRNYAYYGVYFGLFGIVILIAAIAYIVSFNTKFLWYLIYVISVGLFVFNDLGLAQKYIYPDSATIGGHARLGITYIMMIALNLFISSYFRTKIMYPATHKFILGCCIGIGLIASNHLIFTDTAIENATIVLILFYALILCTIGAGIRLAVSFYHVEKYSSVLFISAFSFIFAAGIVFIMSEFGLIAISPMIFTPLQIASVFEIIFLSVGIAWQIRIAEKERLILNDKVARLENENLRSYIRGTEKERARVAMELHDVIGSRLSQLSRSVDSEQKETFSLKKEIKTILQNVRHISHKLSPSGLSMFGLHASVQQMVNEVNQQSNIEYAFQALDVPVDLPEDVAIQFYRIIQESIQNIEKHSDAKNAEIQIIGQENQVVLTIDDDGNGFIPEESKTNGIGLYNIRKRVAYFGGEFTISSEPGHGVQIVITMPLAQ